MMQLDKYLQPGPDKTYLQAMIDPFAEEAVGVRVPSMTPESTFASYDYDTINFTANSSGRALMIMNYDANSIPHWLLLNHASLGDFFSAVPQPLTVNLGSGNNTTVQLQAYVTGLNITQLR